MDKEESIKRDKDLKSWMKWSDDEASKKPESIDDFKKENLNLRSAINKLISKNNELRDQMSNAIIELSNFD